MSNEIMTADTANIVPGFCSAAAIKQLQIITEVFNKSSLVPEIYRGENNKGNCAIVLAMAARMNIDMLMALQNTYVVYGTPALSSKMMIALFNTSGKYTSIRYEETGKKGTDSQGVRAYTTELSTGERIVGPEVTIKIAKDEGWYGKNGSKWRTMPDQMLRYRAASWLIRTTAPELSLGLQTADEVEDSHESDLKARLERNITPQEPDEPPVLLEDAVKAEESPKPAAEIPMAKDPQLAAQINRVLRKEAPRQQAAPAPKRAAFAFSEADLPPMAPPPEEPDF